MPYYREIDFACGTRVHVWRASECVDELERMCAAAGLEPARVAPARSPARRAEQLAEHLLLGRIFGRPVLLEHDGDGSPFVAGEPANLSVSHSRGMVCVGVNATRHFGIDIERRGDRVLRVRGKFLNAAELSWISAGDVEATLLAWSAKEAIYKAAFTPGLSGQDDIVLSPFAVNLAGSTTFGARCRQRDVAVTAVWIDGYCLAHACALGAPGSRILEQ